MKKKQRIAAAFALTVFGMGVSMFGQLKPARAADVLLNRKHFSKSILDTCERYDKNGDNHLSPNEISGLKHFEIEIDEWESNREINCKGLEYLTGLKDINLEGKSFKNLKVGDFNKLKTFTLNCRSGINKLSFEKAPNIENLEVRTTKGVIKNIDISKNKKIKQLTLRNVENADIGNLNKLKELDCDRNIDISKNPKLSYVHVVGQVKKFDIAANDNVKSFSIYSEKLKDIDLRKNKNLKELSISAPVKNIDVSSNTELKNLEIAAPVKNLDLSKNKKLKYLYINAPVEKIDLSKNTELKEIWIEASVKNIDLSHNKKLTKIYIKAPLEDLDTSMLHSLRHIELSGTAMPDEKAE